jgi:hypothetical protein
METLVNGQSQVAVMRPEAGDWALLTHERNLGESNVLSWSVDGSRILVATDFLGDYYSLNWTADGQIIGIASPMRSLIWKFTPVHR